MDGLTDIARPILNQARWGLLSTHSVRAPGFPFGTIVPILWDPTLGVFHTQVSALAEHTKNLKADARCSILVVENAAAMDPQEFGRLTVVARATIIPPPDADLKARWLAAHPQSERLFALADFAFWSVAPEQARLVAGFGKMGWLTGDELRG
jgi:putative heme iron utilization protein